LIDIHKYIRLWKINMIKNKKRERKNQA